MKAQYFNEQRGIVARHIAVQQAGQAVVFWATRLSAPRRDISEGR